MKSVRSITSVTAIKALEAALKLLEKKSAQKAEAGACIWVTPKGKKLCVRLTPEDCDKIPGMVFIGGTCKESIQVSGK